MTLEQLILQKLDDLCLRITKLEEKMDNHLTSIQNTKKTNRELVFIGIAIFFSAIALFEFVTG